MQIEIRKQYGQLNNWFLIITIRNTFYLLPKFYKPDKWHNRYHIIWGFMSIELSLNK